MKPASIDNWRLIVHPSAPAPWLMGVDEALARGMSEERSVPVLHLYQWEKPSVSIGYFQEIHADVDLDTCRRLGIPVVRRITGGRAIVHDDELTYSVTAPLGRGPFSAGIRPTYEVISRAVVAGLRRLEIPCTFRMPSKNRELRRGSGRSPVCFHTLSYAEVTADGRKLVGSAQKRWPGYFLQHGSIPLSIPADLTHEVLRFASPEARDRSLRAAPRRMAGLREFNSAVSPEGLVGAIRAGFEEVFHARLEPGALTEREIHTAQHLARSRYALASWTKRR